MKNSILSILLNLTSGTNSFTKMLLVKKPDLNKKFS